ncbi:MAG TPA: hypothetical protein VGC87_21500 [Pyrinomonadaceae bacterium]|jgi:hypothetical protein
MKNTNLRNALIGVAIALVAAYFFPAVFLTLAVGPEGIQILFSTLMLRLLLMTSWIFIPLGAALGMLIPRIAAGKGRWRAALDGAGYGAVGGLAAMICFASVFTPRMKPDVLWIAVVAYCAVWVGAYAYVRAHAPALHR